MTNLQQQPSLHNLPVELLDNIVIRLSQPDWVALATVSRALNQVTDPLLTRIFICGTCKTQLFSAKDLTPQTWKVLDAKPSRTDALPRRSFLELSTPRPTLYCDDSRSSEAAMHCSTPNALHGRNDMQRNTSQQHERQMCTPCSTQNMRYDQMECDVSSAAVGRTSSLFSSGALVRTKGCDDFKSLEDTSTHIPGKNAIHFDPRTAKANFLILRHLRQIGYIHCKRDFSVTLLRCGRCCAYLGFSANPSDLGEPDVCSKRDDLLPDISTVVDASSTSPDTYAPREQVNHAIYSPPTSPYNSPSIPLSISSEQKQSKLRRGGRRRLHDSEGIALEFREHATQQSRVFVFRELVDMINGYGRRVNHKGESLEQSDKRGSAVYCGGEQCNTVLFDADDVLPWNQVLESHRLVDMDEYLEWEHAWGQSRPALFVKRIARSRNVTLSNARPVRLRQGLMQVADVHCAGCNRLLGWKFLAEISAHRLVNYDQVRRYGFLRDAVHLSDCHRVSRIGLLN